MTDYFGQVVEIEAEQGAPTLDITGDRADMLWLALEKLGFPPFGKTVGASWTDDQGVVGSPVQSAPERVRLTFPEGTDVDGLQDLLDELDYRPDGTIVRIVV